MIVRWPGHVKPGKVATPVQITDWMPTFTAIAGWRAESDLKWDGTHLTALLTQHAALPDRPLYAVAPNWKSRSVRFGNWKLIVHDDKKEQRTELFDLAADPAEAKNLTDAEPERLRQLTKLMDDISARDRDAAPKD